MSERIDTIDLIDELQWRGLLKDCTDIDGLRDHLADPDNSPRKVYCGFDPTADSLTIGNLVPIMLLAHVKRAGHSPIVVMGGGTGLIGDPSGKSAERQLNTVETIAGFIDKQRPIYSTVLDQIEGPEHQILNNHDWLKNISYIEALRDIGKHFSVNMMMQKESVKERLNNREQGISYTEFSYMILQSYDFSYLYEKMGVTVQIGGSDQYGNIVAGSDLTFRMIRQEFYTTKRQYLELCLKNGDDYFDRWFRNLGYAKYPTNPIDALDMLPEGASYTLSAISELLSREFADAPVEIKDALQAVVVAATEFRDFTRVFGLTAPLVQKADGGKFGKTEKGAVWLTAPKATETLEQHQRRTSPYAYYQFWLNASDEDAVGWIKVFTFLPEHTTVIGGEEVEGVTELIARHIENPGKRELQRTLAQEATRILHGQAAMENAQAAGKALFSGDIGSLDEQTMIEVFASIPTTEHSKSQLADGLDMVEMLKSTKLASSNREARDFLNEGSVSINGEKIDADTKVTEAHLLHGSFIAIRRGKKKWHLTRWNA